MYVLGQVYLIKDKFKLIAEELMAVISEDKNSKTVLGSDTKNSELRAEVKFPTHSNI